MGDSIIAGVGTGTMDRSLPVQFARELARDQACSVHWRVEGENGADIADLRERISGLDKDQQADLILISIGVNDVTGLSSTRRWRNQFKTLVLELKRKWPQAQVIFAGLPPMGRFGRRHRLSLPVYHRWEGSHCRRSHCDSHLACVPQHWMALLPG